MENKAPTDSSDPVKQILQLIEKKIRNLEKRKSRLDTIREKAKNRDAKVELNEEQKEAMEKYDGVVQNIEFAKELQKSVATIVTDHEKQQKKQQKKEKAERAAAEQKRFRELLDVQTLLDGLGEDRIRNDFLHGTHGATVISEADLTHLDNLYQLISPSREEATNYEQEVSEAAEHVVCLLDGRDRPVGGTTYQHLQQLIEQVRASNYFTGKHNGTIHAPAAQPVLAGPCAVLPEALPTQEVAPPSHQGNEPAAVQSVPAYPEVEGKGPVTSSYTGASYFPSTSGFQRPVQDIVPASPFSFLQDSELPDNGGVAYEPGYAGTAFHSQALSSGTFGQGLVSAPHLYTSAASQPYNLPTALAGVSLGGGEDAALYAPDAASFAQSHTFVNSNMAALPSQPGFAGDFNSAPNAGKKINAQHGPQSDYYQGQGQGHRGHGGRGGYRGGRGSYHNDSGHRGGYRGEVRRRDDRGARY